MTNKYFKTFILLISTVVGTSAFAWKIPNGTFCMNNKGHIYGWSISSEATYYVDNFAGMPNPNTSYQVLPSSSDSSFKILELSRDSEVIGSYGPFQWIGSEAITDGKNTYDMNSCKRSQ